MELTGEQKSIQKKYKSIEKEIKVKRILIYLALISLSIVFIFPFLWMLFTAFKPENEAMAFPPRLLPRVWDLENFGEVFQIVPFATFYKNSIIVAGLGTLGTVLSSSLVAYGFARIKATGRGVWFALLMSTLMLPPQVTMIPVYIIWSRLGFVDSLVPLIVPAFLGNSYYIFLLRQFFRTIPKEVEESAYLDGANTFQIYWKLILPMSRAAIITVTLLSFMGFWNDFMNPLIYLHSVENYTLAIGVMQFQGALTVYWGPMMAASTLMLIPLVIIFFTGQKHFVEGIATQGNKG
ncbi:carbohydrate ABC transporter permease [Alkalibacterium pelagium]|uniref:Carbohydrate ABC transporter membrane protein 2, CUT1 family n=1 Tax=Alkalibacterium pelagium TaxID=426702 RepID=A0A1H7IF84_9LACT|nr:carbohydrate ABC transporter permease [Alkalibacterium pelagium]GEN50067.1 sugar ABC transporter permease [Alkalibacterium pelagium]SEK61156.1 carbohydrate ABC transporter membrane protein 2, CUT1 family [Alkalibacterium pelagium]